MAKHFLDGEQEKVLRVAELVCEVIRKYREELNRLNVFPVPDGDTGTNMYTTLKGVVSSLENLSAQASGKEILKIIKDGAMEGARGNSGVMLASWIGGVIDELGGSMGPLSFSTKKLEKALIAGNLAARKSRSNVVEGTMATVMEKMAEAATKARTQKMGILKAAGEVVNAAFVAAGDTPNLLPKLEGKIDSGALGLAQIVLAVQRGVPLAQPASAAIIDEVIRRAAENSVATRHDWEDDNPEFEVTARIIRIPPEFLQEQLVDLLQPVGESIVTNLSSGTLTMHVHTDSPLEVVRLFDIIGGVVLEYRVENMRAQVKELKRSAIANAVQSLPTARISILDGEIYRCIYPDQTIEETLDLYALLQKITGKIGSNTITIYWGQDTPPPQVAEVIGAFVEDYEEEDGFEVFDRIDGPPEYLMTIAPGEPVV